MNVSCISIAIVLYYLMFSELTIWILATQIPFDWLIGWLVDWLTDPVTEWNNGRGWPRSVWQLYQLHTCPVETVPAVVERELWSMSFTTAAVHTLDVSAGGIKTPSLWHFALVVLALSIKHSCCSFTAHRQQRQIQTNTSFCSSFYPCIFNHGFLVSLRFSHASLTTGFLSLFVLAMHL